MGSNQDSGGQGNWRKNLNQNINIFSLSERTLENIKTFKVLGIQFGVNPLTYNNNNNKLGEKDDDPQSNYSAPPAVSLNNEAHGTFDNIQGIGKNNYVHCFCFLEVEELAESDEGIIIEFGEYSYGEPNYFNVKTFYTSKKGGLRLYIVKKKLFKNHCGLARVKCKINKREILDDILVGISKKYKWRLEFYDKQKQNSHDFVVVLLNYLEMKNYEFCKGSFDMIPDKIKNILKNEEVVTPD